MSLPLFFHAKAFLGEAIELDESSTRHIVHVLRMQAGEYVELTNGKGLLWTGIIQEAGKKKCIVRIEQETYQKPQTARRAALAVSPVKNAGRFEWMLEKVTELGIREIFPLKCSRSVKEHYRMDRLRQICLSAMLQSRQVWLPLLHEPIAFSEFVKSSAAKSYHHRWIAHCADYEKHNLARILQHNMEDSLLLIGPEGDFTPEEIFEATNGGYVAVSLGNTRLRTETAGMIGSAIMCLC